MLATLAVMALALAAPAQDLPPPERMLTSPTNCTGWPQRRQWVEAQQWWTNDGDDINSASQHFHVGGCMPYNQTLTGVVTIDILFQIHNNPLHRLREIYFLAPAVVATGSTTVDTSLKKIGSTGPVNFSCPAESAMTCMTVFRIQVDTALVPVDGVAPLRVRADVTPLEGIPNNLTAGVGYGYVPELSFKVRYTNGKPPYPMPADPNFIPEAGTVGAGFNDFPWGYTRLSINHDVLPTRPLSGMWTIRQLQSFDQRAENRIHPVVAPVTRSFVTVNPRFHAMDPATKRPAPILGSIVLDVPNMIYQNVRVNTTGLNNGNNVLFFRSDSYIKPGTILPDQIPWLPGQQHMFSGGVPHPGGTSSAVLTFAFVVDNSSPTAAQ